MSQQPSHSETLFRAAAGLASSAERAVFLDRECAGDAVLRAAVEALLRASGEAGAGLHDARTVLAPPDATMLMPEAGAPKTVVFPHPAPGDAPAKQAAPVALPLGNYAVGGEIARGGMGSILEAEDRKLGRKVAMKVMRLEVDATGDQRQRFIREATVLARLEHPNIVPIHELGRDAEDRLYYTMKLVQGRTLQAILNAIRDGDESGRGILPLSPAAERGTMPLPDYTLDRLLTIFRKICDALSMAHAKGVIHRDLKPENVMVGEFGEVLVMDWGLAKILGDAEAGGARSGGLQPPTKTHPRSGNHAAPTSAADAEGASTAVANRRSLDGAAADGATLDGTVMGTPHYMSPEQADGRVSDIDQQSDVFSLGAILYALLTLHPPVEASSIREVLERIKRGEIRPPTEYNSPMKTGGKGQSLADAAADPKKFQPLPHCPGGKVPVALSAVTMRALAVDKAQRYATVAAFAADIEAYQGGFATSAEHAGAWKLLTLLVKRNKALFSSALAAAVIIAAVVGVAFQRVAGERNVAVGERKIALQERNRAESQRKVADSERIRAENALSDLANTAPTFAAQATGLVEQGDLEEALEKIGYAVSLDARNPDYLLQQANLLQATQQLAKAAEGYRGALALRADPAAKMNLELCEKLLRDNAGNSELKRESQGELATAMIKQGRAVEAAPLSGILGEGSDTALVAIRARLKPFLAITGSNAGVSRLPNGSFRLNIHGNSVVDLPRLDGLPITEVDLYQTKVSDLTPLKGLRLRLLSISGSPVSDLSPLAGMPLEYFHAHSTKVSDLTPIRGMPLKDLNVQKTSVADLRPLAGMPIEKLNIANTEVNDLSPLAGMPLTSLNAQVAKITDLAPLRGMPLHFLDLWRNPVSDLSPLGGMPIEELHLSGLNVTDIEILRALPLKRLLLQCPAVKDLRPLADCKLLEMLVIPKVTSDISFLRALPNLQRLFDGTVYAGSMDSRLPTAEQFWQQYDAQKAAEKK